MVKNTSKEFGDSTVSEYIALIENFVDNKINAVEFEELFLELHSYDDSNYGEDIHRIISILFSEIDRFCSDPTLRSEDDIDEIELKEKAKDALILLKAIFPST